MSIGADPIEPVAVQTGQSTVLQTAGLTRVAVGDGKIAGIVPIGTSEIVVNGKTSGRTTLFVWRVPAAGITWWT